jgi:3-oxoacyl-[acyl-carrier protein] reductase
MEKKYAIITANAKGIGRAMTLDLARQGYNVLINWFSDSSQKDAQTLAAECSGLGVTAVDFQADVKRYEDVRAMREFAVGALGQNLELLICNAGIRLTGDLTGQRPEDYVNVIEVGLIGAMHCAHEFGALMKTNKFGRVIFMGSTVGMLPQAECCAYTTAKAGLIGLTRGLALDLAPFDITVNHIASGFVSTARTLGEGEKLLGEVLSRQKIKRLGTFDDVINTMNYIIGNPFLTGATIAINGGEYMY